MRESNQFHVDSKVPASVVTFVGCFATSFPSLNEVRRAVDPRSLTAVCDPTFRSTCDYSAAVTLTISFQDFEILNCHCCDCESDYDFQRHRSFD